MRDVVANTGRPDAKPVLYLPPPRQCPPITAHYISLCEVACRQAHGNKVSVVKFTQRLGMVLYGDTIGYTRATPLDGVVRAARGKHVDKFHVRLSV